MGNPILTEHNEKYHEIRSIILEFLDKCDIAYPHNACVDPAFDEDVHAECKRRGYDMETLAPFIRVGVDITGTSYTHLKDQNARRYIAIYTTYVTYLDDICQTDAGIGCVASFFRRFLNKEPQEYKILDDAANAFREASSYWRPVSASLVLSATYNFISSLFLDHETKDMKLGVYAIQYPPFARRLSGISEAYTVFAFPPEMPASCFTKAIPDIVNFTNYANDIMSFYKEELQGEEQNYISLFGKTRRIEKMDSMKLVADYTAKAHERVVNMLEGEAYACYKSYSEGYIGFHAVCRRYKLDQLNM